MELLGPCVEKKFGGSNKIVINESSHVEGWTRLMNTRRTLLFEAIIQVTFELHASNHLLCWYVINGLDGQRILVSHCAVAARRLGVHCAQYLQILHQAQR